MKHYLSPKMEIEISLLDILLTSDLEADMSDQFSEDGEPLEE